MPNRREQKKQQSFAAIVNAAAASFDSIGYDATAIESIARTAGVSAGTVYNYFGTKHALLAAVVTRQIDEIMGDVDGSLDFSTEDPVAVMMPMLGKYIDRMTEYGPALLKELFRAGFDPAHTDLLAELVSADEHVIARLGELLHHMESRGLVSPNVDIARAAFLIYSVVAVALMMFAAVPGTSPTDVVESVQSQLVLVFEGLGATR